MLSNETANKIDNNALNLRVSLAQKLILGAIITAIGFILLAVSGKQDIDAILQEQRTPETSATISAAPKTAAIASWLMVIGTIILTQVAVIRLEETNTSVQDSTEASSIIPNMNIAMGFKMVVLGNIIKAIGTQQRAEHSQATIT